MDAITISEASARSGYGPEHIRWLARSGLVKARRFGLMWMVDRRSLEKYLSVPHPRGPKPKEKRGES